MLKFLQEPIGQLLKIVILDVNTIYKNIVNKIYRFDISAFKS
jgi:hypothetical protein